MPRYQTGKLKKPGAQGGFPLTEANVLSLLIIETPVPPIIPMRPSANKYVFIV
jgi:hypothetical protein